MKSRARTLLKELVISVVMPFFHIIPIKSNFVFVNSNNGKSFTDNPKSIFDELNKQFPGKFKYIITLNQGKLNYKDVRVVRYMSPKYLYYIAISKYWVANINLYSGIKKRQGQIYLQTWHGTPLKKIGQDIVDNKRNREKLEWQRDANQWDFFISNSKVSNKNYQSAFLLKEDKILPYGLPRNDRLKVNKKLKSNFIKKNKIEGKKIVLYAPTYRDDGSRVDFDFEKFSHELGDKYFLIVNFHRLYRYKDDIKDKNIFINDDELSITECMEISDLLITDYSSIFFDYSLMLKPMLFYAYDFEKYTKQDRGLYYDYEKLVPGDIVTNFDELIFKINNISIGNNNSAFAVKFNANAVNKNAAEKVVKHVFRKN